MTQEMLLSEIDLLKREEAYKKYKIIEPFLENSQSLIAIHKQSGTPKRTLMLWIKKYRTFGLKGLVHQQRSDKGTTRVYNPSLQQTIEGTYLNYPTLSCANIYRLIIEYCKQKDIKAPSYRLICRIIQGIPEDVKVLAVHGGKAYKQKYDLLHIRSAARPNEIWQADHVLLDIPILNTKNQPQHPWLTVIIDDCSRAICGYELSFLSPSSIKTSLCLRNAIWRKSDPRWKIMGIPEILYTDHGSDFTSKHIEQVCIDIKTRLIFSQVGQPRGRGKIERFFRTLNQTLLSQIKPLIESKNFNKQNLNLKSLELLIYDFFIIYNDKVHSDLGISPTARWELHGFLPQMLNSLEELDLLLLMEAKLRRVLRDGIHFQGLRYIDPILANYVGENVLIRYNPSDVSSLRVYHKEKFLCQPVCSELSRESISIKEIQRVRNQRKQQLKKKIIQRKSFVEAVIEANNKTLPIKDVEPPFIKEPQMKTRLKLYESD